MSESGQLRILTSLIAPDALLPLLEDAYDLERPLHCHLVSSNDNDHYVVTSRQARHVLRIYRRTKHWVEHESNYHFELEWLAFLYEKGLPVSGPIRRRDGRYLGSLNAPEGPRYWALFSYAPGKSVLDRARSRIYGESVARIHVASNEFQSVHPRCHFDLDRIAERPLQQIRSWLGNRRREEVEFLAGLAAELKDRVAAAGVSRDEYGIIGGDFQGSNHHFTEENELTHFDFDLCGYGWRAYDVAVFRWGRGAKQEIWSGFLEGYEAVRPLSDRDKTLIPVFVQLRHIWLMGSHTTSPLLAAWLDADWDGSFNHLRKMNQKWREAPTALGYRGIPAAKGWP